MANMQLTDRAKQAYAKGVQARLDSQGLNENPYLIMPRKYMGLSGWWEKGWTDTNLRMLENTSNNMK